MYVVWIEWKCSVPCDESAWLDGKVDGVDRVPEAVVEENILHIWPSANHQNACIWMFP